jgi:DnaK suppressor protein
LHVRQGILPSAGARLLTIIRICSMPLTAAQLKHLEMRLNDERARLLGQLHEFTDTESVEDSQDLAGDLSKFPTHPADIGTDMANEELEASISTRVSAEISEIDAALDRITTSPETFGVDEQTGDDIPFERLDIIPYARIAVER